MADTTNTTPHGVAAGIVAGPPQPGPEQEKLQVIIGKWINQGETVATPETPAVKITASDVYEWAAGGFFVMHPAYGRIGDVSVGGVEIIGYDVSAGTYKSYFFDSQGNFNVEDITIEGNTWIWQGKATRCTAVFSNDGKTQTAHHERLNADSTWVPSMNVTLHKNAN